MASKVPVVTTAARKLGHELCEFAVAALYLYGCFGALNLYREAILNAHRVSYSSYDWRAALFTPSRLRWCSFLAICSFACRERDRWVHSWTEPLCFARYVRRYIAAAAGNVPSYAIDPHSVLDIPRVELGAGRRRAPNALVGTARWKPAGPPSAVTLSIKRSP